MLSLGQSFQYKDFNSSEWSHIWFIVTTPAGQNGTALILNVTTRYSTTQDTNCILRPGDHDAIDRESVINYGESERPQIVDTASYQPNHSLRIWAPVADAVLNRIHNGAEGSPFIEPKFLRMIEQELQS